MKKSVKTILICLAVVILAGVIIFAVRGGGRSVAVSKLDEIASGR